MKVSINMIVLVYIFSFSCYCVALDNGYEMESEFQINTTTTGSQWDPRITSDGVNYFAVWKSDDGDENGVYGQRLDKFTSLSGPELLINTYTTSHQMVSSIASNSSNYLITWSSIGQDGSTQSIYAQLIGTDGSIIGSEFKINTYTTGTQGTASAVASSSNYMIVWTSEGQDGSLYGIFGQLIDSNGTKIGSEFQVNTYTTDWQNTPSVACNGSDFLIAWMSRNQDGNESGVFAQLLDNSGTKIGSEFQVNTYTTNYQTDPVIASNGSLYMVVWYNIAPQDGDSYGVFGQLVDNSAVQKSILSFRLIPTPQTHNILRLWQAMAVIFS